MANDILTLSASVRSNLLFLQDIATNIQKTQERLATGKKVNSAIDDPVSYFKSVSLGGRADTLDSKLNDMQQATQTIKAASQGISGITKLIEQARAVANAAKSTSDTAQQTAYAGQFNELITQMTNLANNSGYQGINLLNNNTLVVGVDTSSTYDVSVAGATYTSSSGLSIASVDVASWNITSNIDASLSSLANALSALQVKTTEFATKGAVIDTRIDFTKSFISTLRTGADLLVKSDDNEEAANLLALQTRQSMSISALSLATQSERAILSLF